MKSTSLLVKPGNIVIGLSAALTTAYKGSATVANFLLHLLKAFERLAFAVGAKSLLRRRGG